MTPDFISIVGVSRSGTSLMRNVLSSSAQVAIADENNYLGHLIASEGARYKFRAVGDLAEDENVRRLVDFIYSGALNERTLFNNSAYWGWLREHVDASALAERLRASDRTERAVFDVLMRVYADAEDKPIMGEKTPNHYRYVDTLLDWFPRAKIIHMVRDPRGNYVSELKRRWRRPAEAQPFPYRQLKRFDPSLQLFALLLTTVAWYQSVRGALAHRQQFPERYFVMRFEDLVSNPSHHVRELCNFLEISFNDDMLDQGVARGHFNRGQSGFDENAPDRWKNHIGPWAERWLKATLGGKMEKLGYG